MSSSSGRLKAGCVLIPLIAILSIAIYNVFTQWIPAGAVGLVYNASSGLDDKVYTPQRLFLWPTQRLYTYPTRLQAAIYSSDPAYGEQRSADAIAITTADNAQTAYDVVVYYRVKRENVNTVFKEFGPISLEDVQSQHIRRFVKEAVNAVGPKYSVWELMGEKRQEASEKIKDRLVSDLGKRGISIEHAFLINPQPVGDVNGKVTARVNAYTALVVSKLGLKIAEIDGQIAVVKGKTEAKSRSIIAAQSSAKSLEMQRLEIADEAVDAWSGAFSPLSSNGKQTIIVNGADASVPTAAVQGNKEDQ